MSKRNTQRFRMVNAILKSYSARLVVACREQVQAQARFTASSLSLEKYRQMLSTAESKGYMLSAGRLRARLDRIMEELQSHLINLRRVCQVPSMPRFADLVKQLQSIEDEFGGIELNLRCREISVISDPVELDGLELGRFAIRLWLDFLSSMETPYRVTAFEPCSSGRDHDVVHPHISRDVLCEGDGTAAVGNALRDGRLYDFFVIVHQILHTYNPDSAYVRIDEWDGMDCYECGYTSNSEDCVCCESCGHDVCSQCSSSCQICMVDLCISCVVICSSCREPVCEQCSRMCDQCGGTVCSDCLLENGICKSCEAKRKENEDEQKETTPTAEPAV